MILPIWGFRHNRKHECFTVHLLRALCVLLVVGHEMKERKRKVKVLHYGNGGC